METVTFVERDGGEFAGTEIVLGENDNLSVGPAPVEKFIVPALPEKIVPVVTVKDPVCPSVIVSDCGDAAGSSKKTKMGEGQLLKLPGEGSVQVTAYVKAGAPKDAESMSTTYAAAKKDFCFMKNTGPDYSLSCHCTTSAEARDVARPLTYPQQRRKREPM